MTAVTRRQSFFSRFAAAGMIAGCLLAAPAWAAPTYPFGSHPMSYAAGTIRPSHVATALQDDAVRDFYDAWKARFVRQTCGTGRWLVLTATDPDNLTVAEGHGYGMILAALMAGHDPDAQTIFDGMFAYFRDHPTAFHQHLMGSYQDLTCATPPGDFDSATDGDLDIAYALLLADRQWGSCGTVNYLLEAQRVLVDIADGELDATKTYVLLGDWVVPSESVKYYDATRSSDFMPGHTRSFAAASGNASWNAVRDRVYAIVHHVQATASPATGLLPDFVASPLDAPHPVSGGFLEGPNDGRYSYNACRDPWRLATDFVVSGDTRARDAVERINAWIRGTTGGDPSAIASGYKLDGTVINGADYLSMAFVAPLGVGAMVDGANQTWLNAIWDLVVATPITTDGYYENTLKLLTMIVMSGNFWAPERVAADPCVAPTLPPVATPTPTATVTPACATTPRADCRTPVASGGASFALRDRSPDTKDTLQWKWSKGAATSGTDLGDPTTITTYDLCVYEGTALSGGAAITAGGSCAGRPCWTTTGTGFRYRDKSALPHGVTALDLRAGTDGKARVTAKGKGTALAMPAPPLALPVTVQLANDAGICWSASYATDIRRNQAGSFDAKSD